MSRPIVFVDTTECSTCGRTVGIGSKGVAAPHKNLVAGHLGRQVGGLAACAAALDIPFPEDVQHTAEGDARMCMAIWDRIMGGPDA